MRRWIVLIGGLIGACSAQPVREQALVAVEAAPVHAPLQAYQLTGPLADDPALQDIVATTPVGQTDRLRMRLRDYLHWLEWEQVQIDTETKPDAMGRLAVHVSALSPGAFPEAPAGRLFVRPEPPPQPSVSSVKPVTLDARYRDWLSSGSRVLIETQLRALYFKDADGLVLRFPVAVGAPSRRTPPGHYRVEAITPNPTWYPPESLRLHYARKGRKLPRKVPPGEGNPLGSYFIKLQRGIGIHGTNQPSSIGQAISWGCVRMRSSDVELLASRLDRGDEVTVVRRVSDPDDRVQARADQP